MIRFKFNLEKATQAAAEVLKSNDNHMNYMKLIKLLYLIDREGLKRWERPITGDTYFSMKNGPILSNVLDLINWGDNPKAHSYWHEYISDPCDYEVNLIKEVPSDELSPREIDSINEIDRIFKTFDHWEMVDYCHDNLPEWEDPGNTSSPILIDDILKVLDKTYQDITEIQDEIETFNYANDLISRLND